MISLSEQLRAFQTPKNNPKTKGEQPFDKPHPFQILRFCWKFPHSDPQTELYDLSGLDDHDLVQQATLMAISKAESLSHHSTTIQRRRRRRKHD